MRRKKRTHRKRSGLSAGHRSPAKTHRRRKGLSAGMFSKNSLIEGLKTVGLSAGGGAIAPMAKKALVGFKLSPIGTLLVGGIIGFAGSAMGWPKISSGFTGGLVALTMADGGLKDDLEDDSLEDLPIYQTESGDFVKMLNDGQLVPLSEDELSEIEMYPPYSTMNTMQH